MNPVSNAVREIEMTIPVQILKEAFGNERYGGYRRVVPVSIDELIKSKVLRKRVIKDCNLIGGREVVFSLESVPHYQYDDSTIIYQIPMELTNNREIISVLNVGYASMAAGNFSTGFGGTEVQAAGMRVMDSHSNVPHVSTARAEVIGYNTISITDKIAPSYAFTIRAIVAYDENLSTIQPRSYPVFAKACILATKSFIYNELNIRMDQGVLEQGQNLGRLRDVVDSYQDAEAEYQEYLIRIVRKTLFMNDVKAYGRFIKLQINPGL